MFKVKPFLKKYGKEIAFLFQKDSPTSSWGKFEYLDQAIINENFELEMYWEYDCDYNGSSGTEPVDWTMEKANEDGYSWTHSDMNEIAERIFGMSLKELNIRSFKDFLEEMKKD